MSAKYLSFCCHANSIFSQIVADLDRNRQFLVFCYAQRYFMVLYLDE